MKKFTILLCVLLTGVLAWAQTTPPADVTATALSQSKVKIAWNAPDGTTQPARLNLFNQADMVTHPGLGHNGADVSALYGGQAVLGPNANANSHYWLADDFTLTGTAMVREIEFYAYQTGSSTTSSFTGCYVSIYNTEPIDSTAEPIWTSGTTSCMTSTSWTGIYRTGATAMTDTTRPIMRIVAGINTSLPAGNYWVAVCFTGSISSGPWGAPRAVLGEVTTGNAIQYLPGEGAWGPWRDYTVNSSTGVASGSMEQMGMPFIVRGEFVSDNLNGFNVYRGSEQLNSSLIEAFSFIDEGLDEETEYCYTVEAVYATGATSMSDAVCVTTLYNPCRITSMPYSESFDTYGTGYSAYPNVAYPTCWSKINTTTATSTLTLSYPYITTTNHSAPGSLYLYAGTNYYVMAITPLIDSNTIDISSLRATMMLRKGSAAYNIVIGTIVDPSDPSTFEPYDTLSPSAASTWEQFKVNFDHYTGNAHYIAMRSGSGSATNYVYVDDFVLDYIPTCEAPSAVEISATTANSITVSWTPITAAPLWNIEYKMEDEEDWIEISDLTTTSYTIDNLEPNTLYTFTFRVKAICSETDESAWLQEVITGRTGCVPETDFPYFEGFEDYGSGASGAFYPTCWSRPVAYNTGTTTAPFCNTGQKKNGNASLRFQGGAWAATPQLDVDIHALQLTFWLRKEGASSGDFQVGVMSNASDTSTFELVETLPVAATATWYYYELNLNNTQLSGSGNYIVFRQVNNTSNIYYYWLDDVNVDIIPTCIRPTALSSSDTTTTSVTLHWYDEFEVGSYELQYKLLEDTEWVSVTGIVDTTYLLDDLLPSSIYNVQVRTVCSETDQSGWSDVYTFHTLCVPVSEIPYYEGFESYGYSASGSNYPICWTRPLAYNSSTITAPFCNSSQKHSGNASLRFQGKAWAATPQIDDEIHDLQVSFWLREEHPTSSGVMQVGVMSNPVDTSTFELVETIHPGAMEDVWLYYEVNFNNTLLTGTGNVIAFRQANTTTTNYYYWIDDVDVHYIPTCVYPTNLTASEETQNSVTLSWSDVSNATSYMVKYRTLGSTEWTEEMSYSTSITLNNLVANSAYEWNVKTICSGDDESIWNPAMGQFRTECGPISDFPYRESFDIYGTGYSGYPDVAYPTCWSKFNNTTATATLTLSYPYINTTNYSAPGSLYMYAASGYYTMAMLPPIDSLSGVEVNQLQLTFMARKTSASYVIVVGVMTDPDDASTFVAVDTVSPSAASTWELMDVPLSAYEGTGRYITFRSGSGSAINAYYIDDVVLDYIPTCFRPTDVTISQIGQTEATVSWDANGNESTWQLNYKTESDEDWTELSVTTNTYTLTNLEVNTSYQLMVKALCDDGQESEFSVEKSFTTLCEPMEELPFVEHFDSYASGTAYFPNCWIRQTNSTTSYPYISSSYSVSPTLSLYFTASTTTYCYAALPALPDGVNIQELQVSLMARKGTTASYKLEMGVMSDPYDLSTYTVLQTFSPAATSTWEAFTFYLNSYQGEGRFIVFKTPSGVATTFYLDDIAVDYAPECLVPNQVHATNITSSSASIGWGAAPGETDWQIVYGVSGFSIDEADPMTITTNPYELTGLEPNTSYDVYVRTLCNNGEISAYSPVCTFTTGCAPIELPYSERFDTYGTGTSTYPECWKKINNNTNFPYIYAMTASTGLTLPGALYFSTTATTFAYAILPEFDAEINTLQLTFAFKAAMGNGYFLDIGVMSDVADTSTFELVQTIEPRTSVWNGFTVAFTGYEGNGRYIAIRSKRDASNVAYIDNVLVDYAPGCVAPMHLEAENLTWTTADVSWRPGRDENEWIVSYGPINYNPNVAGVSQTVSAFPITLTDLEPGTFYDFYVKAVCDGDETSEWSIKGSFRTECLLIDNLPYTESFDTYGTGNTIFPNCWNRNTTYSTTIQYPYISTTSYSAPGALYFYSTSSTYNYVTLPEFDETIDVSTLRATFKLYKSSAAYRLKVGVMTDPSDKNTFVEMATLSPSTTSTWETFKVDFHHYTGEGHFIAFASDTAASNYMYLDNVMIDYAPTCHEVENVHVSDITASQATVSWTTVSEGTSWVVEYGPAGFTQGSTVSNVVIVNEPFAVLTGLTDGTMYDVYVKQQCGGGDESPWSEKVTFSTNCLQLSLPYVENFDDASYNATTYNTPGDAPLCWTTITNNTTYPAPHIIGGGSSYYYFNSASNSLVFTTGSAGNDAYAVLPEFTSPLNTLKLSFWRAMESSTSGQLYVGYVTDKNNIAATFTPVATIASIMHSGTGGGGVDSVDFSTLSSIPAAGYITFRWSHNTSFYSCCIDDIRVETTLLCEQPANVTVSNLTAQSATVAWTAGGATQWEVAYKTVAATEWSTQTVSAATAELTGLMPQTDYVVKVRVICATGVYSDWSLEAYFTTESAGQTCLAPTALSVGNITATTAHINWTPLGTESSWRMEYTLHGGSSWETQTVSTPQAELSNLASGSTYDVRVKALCSEGNESEYATTTFSTPVGINNVTLTNSISLMPNPADKFIELQINLNVPVDEVIIYNAFGQKIQNVQLVENHARIDLSEMASGMYFVRVNGEGVTATKKFIRK